MATATSSATPAATINPRISKENREKCWKARDAFFQCLDQHKAVVRVEDGSDCPTACEPLRKPFNEDCIPSWSKYFLVRRLQKQRDESLQDKS